MADGDGAGWVALGLGLLGFLGLVAVASASQEKDTKKRALLERIDKEVQEAKQYLKKDT